MRKLALSAAITLFAAISVTSCSSGDGTPKAKKSSKEVSEGTTNIRVYDMDSVAKHYKLIERLNSESESSATKYQTAVNNYQATERQKATEIQNLAQSIDNKMRSNGYLSEASYNSDMQSLQTKQNAAQQHLAKLQQELANMEREIQVQAMAQQQELLDSINNFLKDYNAVNGFDAVLAKAPGSIYSDEIDITDEIIEGLNARYKAPEAKAETKDDAKKSDEKTPKK